MEYYLGIDGGGTKTKVSIIDENEHLVFQNTSGPSSIDTVSREETYSAYEMALTPFMTNNPEVHFSGAYSAQGGVVTEDDWNAVETIIRDLPPVDKNTFVRVRNDMFGALFSSGHFDSGMALICGTGMVAFGKHKGMTHKCGGWSYKEGELGSSYHLGREAIRYAIRCLDGRFPIDDMGKELLNILHLNGIEDIIPVMNLYFDNRTKTANLAPIITKYANLGNHHAKRIIHSAIDELVLAIQGVYKALNFTDTTLVIIGSLGNAEGYFHDMLIESIKRVNAGIEIVPEVFDPSMAAAIAAKRYAKGELS